MKPRALKFSNSVLSYSLSPRERVGVRGIPGWSDVTEQFARRLRIITQTR